MFLIVFVPVHIQLIYDDETVLLLMLLVLMNNVREEIVSLKKFDEENGMDIGDKLPPM